ncbi:MAG: glycosyltransferase [Actinomycetota bacterium]|nr:glycosyltransferase [Actinomycetota bacterium]
MNEVAGDLTVVIPTLGRPLLKDCLESVAANRMHPHRVIVVNQGDAGPVQEWIDEIVPRGLEIEHVVLPVKGIAAATNSGLRRVETRYAASTHDDCRVAENWVESLTQNLPEIGEAVLTGRVEPDGDGLVLTTVTSNERKVYTRPLIDGDVLFPPNMALAIDVFERVGPYDEHPSLRVAGEDCEWAHRALRAGFPIVYEPRVAVSHLAWQESSELGPMYRRYARGHGAFYAKHLLRGDVFILRRVLRDLTRAPYLLVRGLVTNNRDLIAMGAGEVLGLPVGIVAGMRGRAKFRKRRDGSPDGS